MDVCNRQAESQLYFSSTCICSILERFIQNLHNRLVSCSIKHVFNNITTFPDFSVIITDRRWWPKLQIRNQSWNKMEYPFTSCHKSMTSAVLSKSWAKKYIFLKIFNHQACFVLTLQRRYRRFSNVVFKMI